MTESDKKLLTEFLEECRHESDGLSYDSKNLTQPWICKYCKVPFGVRDWRTFTTWGDLGACKDALVEKGLWRKFIAYALNEWLDSISTNQSRLYWDEARFTEWLFRPVDENGEPHFCRLVADWLKER
jgi:hypothetical protein